MRCTLEDRSGLTCNAPAEWIGEGFQGALHVGGIAPWSNVQRTCREADEIGEVRFEGALHVQRCRESGWRGFRNTLGWSVRILRSYSIRPMKRCTKR